MGIAGRIERSHYPDRKAAGPNAGAPDNFMGGAGAHPSALEPVPRPGMAPNAPVDTAEYASQLEQQIAARAEREFDREAGYGKPVAPDHVMSRIGESERSAGSTVAAPPPRARRHVQRPERGVGRLRNPGAKMARARARGADPRQEVARAPTKGGGGGRRPAAPVDRQSAASVRGPARAQQAGPRRRLTSAAARGGRRPPRRCGGGRQGLGGGSRSRPVLAQVWARRIEPGSGPKYSRSPPARREGGTQYKWQLTTDKAQREELKRLRGGGGRASRGGRLGPRAAGRDRSELRAREERPAESDRGREEGVDRETARREAAAEGAARGRRRRASRRTRSA